MDNVTVSEKTNRRRKLIDIVRRRCRPGAGSITAFLRRRTIRMRFPDISKVLGDIPHAVVGAAAARAYMPERTTADLDVAVLREDADRVRDRLSASGYTYRGELTVGGSSWVTPDGFPVDVLELESPWAEQALRESVTNRDAQGLRILPLPYLVLCKLEAGRSQDIADITRMLGQADEATLDAVRRVVRMHLPDALEDIESLAELGRMELQ